MLLWGLHVTLFSSIWADPIFLACLRGKLLQSPYEVDGPPLELLQQFHVLFSLGTPEQCSVLQVGSHSILNTQKHPSASKLARGSEACQQDLHSRASAGAFPDLSTIVVRKNCYTGILRVLVLSGPSYLIKEYLSGGHICYPFLFPIHSQPSKSLSFIIW